MAHITGGGLVENVPRVIPEHLQVRLDARSWALPPVFKWLARSGQIAHEELTRVFNCGIGMVVVVPADKLAAAMATLAAAGETPIEIGRVVPKPDGEAPGCVVDHLDSWQI
jgi:phosphoribosylformylglycinamidine cyclo-ligase